MDKSTKNKTRSPHDNLIIETFNNKKNVRTFMQEYLPENILKEINLKKISIDTSQYVSDELKKYTSDIVICTELRKKNIGVNPNVDIYILFEHKSFHDDKILVQLLKYIVLNTNFLFFYNDI